MLSAHGRLVFTKHQPLMYREEDRGSLLPRLSRDEQDHAEYLQSPKEHRCGEDPFYRPDNTFAISASYLCPFYGRRLICSSMGDSKTQQGVCLHGTHAVLKGKWAYVSPL